MPIIRISVRASFFGATLTARPAVPQGNLLASMSDPKLSALMIPSLGTLNKPQWRLLWRNPRGFHTGEDTVKFTRQRYQSGSLSREVRKAGPAVWIFRWREESNGKKDLPEGDCGYYRTVPNQDSGKTCR